jgi:dolichyl-diphosphooligosaccharide--protein glycosyltransferase
LNSQTTLFQSGRFNIKLNHLVIIGVLVLAFSLSFLIRSQPAEYGNELMEFDPFFNFRATEYILENGFSEYFTWNDDRSWYLPLDGTGLGQVSDYGKSISNSLVTEHKENLLATASGRDVSATSQVMLHTTAAITYQIFGGNLNLYDFTILFPVVIGSLTVIIIFGLVRVFSGTTAGLIASLLFGISLPIIVRGSIGWFKSEPLGIFYALLSLYLFFSGIRSENKKIAFLKIIFGGIVMTFAMASWGGIQFFIIPLGLFILILPFVRKDHKFLIWSIPLFVGTFLLTAFVFERPGPNFVFGVGGISLMIPTLFLIFSIFIQKISKDEHKIRNVFLVLFVILVVASVLILLQAELNPAKAVNLPSFRYLNALNPFLITTDPLTDSVAEHQSTNIELSFLYHSILLISSGIGAWFLLSKKIPQHIIFERNDMRAFVLIMGMTGVYVSSAFIRLEIFASISLIFLTSIGLSILLKEIFKINLSKKKNYLLKISTILILFTLFAIPLVYPTNSNWINNMDFPPTILNGGTSYPPSNDWLETLEWIKINTPEDSIVISWWDYGYWITTLAERITVIDNATLGTWQIAKVAEIFMSTPDEAWNLLTAWDADYVVVYVAAQRLDGDWNGDSLYVLNGGGDESKKNWFMRIADVDESKYLESDGFTASNYFWNETLLGKMIPYNNLIYYNYESKESSQIFQNGFMPISILEINYDDDGNYPLKLVHASPGFTNKNLDRFNAVLVYEVNKNYISINDNSAIDQNMRLEN